MDITYPTRVYITRDLTVIVKCFIYCQIVTGTSLKLSKIDRKTVTYRVFNIQDVYSFSK